MNRPPLVLAYLLTLLAALMGAHLLVLTARDQGCREYERVLLGRLLKVPPGSPEARNIRNEIQNFFDGRYTDCSRTSADFSDTSDKYLAVILSLLTGAGVAAAADQSGITDRLLGRGKQKPMERQDPRGRPGRRWPDEEDGPEEPPVRDERNFRP